MNTEPIQIICLCHSLTCATDAKRAFEKKPRPNISLQVLREINSLESKILEAKSNNHMVIVSAYANETMLTATDDIVNVLAKTNTGINLLSMHDKIEDPNHITVSKFKKRGIEIGWTLPKRNTTYGQKDLWEKHFNEIANPVTS